MLSLLASSLTYSHFTVPEGFRCWHHQVFVLDDLKYIVEELFDVLFIGPFLPLFGMRKSTDGASQSSY
jgi:hypothetical protein